MLRVMAAKTCPLIVKYRENTTPVAIRGCGAAPDTELTPQALAEMSEERFAEILNELQGARRQDEVNAALPRLILNINNVPCCNGVV